MLPQPPEKIPELEEIFLPVKKDLASVERILRSWPKATPVVLRRLTAGAIHRQGKLIRPGILLLIAGHLGVSQKKRAAVLAAAVETMHLASLIHDDIIDRSAFRRGVKTALEKFGPDFSLLLGDFLFVHSLATSFSVKDPAITALLAEAAREMIEGETEELASSYNFNLSQKRYMKIIAKKTASLFRATCRLACRLGKASLRETRALENYGFNLGLTFQIIDDLLDITGDPKKTGKPVFSDLKEGRITLPLIIALKKSDDRGKEELKRRLEHFKNNPEPEIPGLILDWLKKSGALEDTLNQAFIQAEKARASLKILNPTAHRESLARLIDFVLWRNN